MSELAVFVSTHKKVGRREEGGMRGPGFTLGGESKSKRERERKERAGQGLTSVCGGGCSQGVRGEGRGTEQEVWGEGRVSAKQGESDAFHC